MSDHSISLPNLRLRFLDLKKIEDLVYNILTKVTYVNLGINVEDKVSFKDLIRDAAFERTFSFHT